MKTDKNIIVSIFLFLFVFLFSVFLNNTPKTIENFNTQCFSNIEKISVNYLTFSNKENKFNISSRKDSTVITKSNKHNGFLRINHYFKKYSNDLDFIYLTQYKKIKLNKNIKLSFLGFEIQPNAP